MSNQWLSWGQLVAFSLAEKVKTSRQSSNWASEFGRKGIFLWCHSGSTNCWSAERSRLKVQFTVPKRGEAGPRVACWWQKRNSDLTKESTTVPPYSQGMQKADPRRLRSVKPWSRWAAVAVDQHAVPSGKWGYRSHGRKLAKCCESCGWSLLQHLEIRIWHKRHESTDLSCRVSTGWEAAGVVMVLGGGDVFLANSRSAADQQRILSTTVACLSWLLPAACGAVSQRSNRDQRN